MSSLLDCEILLQYYHEIGQWWKQMLLLMNCCNFRCEATDFIFVSLKITMSRRKEKIEKKEKKGRKQLAMIRKKTSSYMLY